MEVILTSLLMCLKQMTMPDKKRSMTIDSQVQEQKTFPNYCY